ncbi:hypothetical protein [Methylocystis echinoides]|uniref:Uncharacterized protein n=1 Tax=Methylocystis echinoides TaxID=29468 RepID=A0A9W6GWN1_9HYPH|nr:hypothetical protein [Methylocystis echinoides]GLI94308.1 hypothetical protein LMG27198_33000 [Methylocystis echinoides]
MRNPSPRRKAGALLKEMEKAKGGNRTGANQYSPGKRNPSAEATGSLPQRKRTEKAEAPKCWSDRPTGIAGGKITDRRAMPVVEIGRSAFKGVNMEWQTNALHWCTRPRVLLKGKR